MSKQFEKIKQLVELRAKARLGGGEKAIEKQHERGKYTARERIEMLLDKDKRRRASSATALSQDAAPSTAALCMSLHRTLRSSAVRSPKRWRRKSAR